MSVGLSCDTKPEKANLIFVFSRQSALISLNSKIFCFISHVASGMPILAIGPNGYIEHKKGRFPLIFSFEEKWP